MAYCGRCEYDDESSTEEEYLGSYRLILSKWKEACLTIDNQKKTKVVLHEEVYELASTITSTEKENSPLNSQLENMSHSESKLINISNLLDERLKFCELSRDEKGINVGTNMKDKSNKFYQ